MKKICILLLAFQMLISPFKSKGMMELPPPSCVGYLDHWVTRGDIFRFKGPIKYVNGLLEEHFEFNSSEINRTFNLDISLLKGDNCYYIDNLYVTVTIPQGVNKFSLRFTSGNNFVIYDDVSNIPLTCDGCNNTFNANASDNNKTYLYISTDYSNDEVEFTMPTSIYDPNPVVSKTPILIVPGILGTEIFKGI